MENLFADVANRHAPFKRKTKGGLKPWITNDIKEHWQYIFCLVY